MIKVINGTVGVFANGLMTPKTSKDGPFELDEKREAELVAAGIAAYVGTVKEEPEDDTPPEDDGQTNDDNNEPEGTKQDDGAHLDPAQLETMTIAQLKSLAGDMGINVSACKVKADFVKAIADATVEPEPDDDLPDLGAADPV